MRVALVYLKDTVIRTAAAASFVFLFLILHYSFFLLLKYAFFLFYASSKAQLVVLSLSVYMLAVVLGFALLSFTSLYGIFFLCTVPAFFFWATLVLNMDFFLLKGGVLQLTLFKWFKLSGLLEVRFELLIDLVSFGFMFLTTTIAIFVTFFAFSYFRYEPNVERLILLLNAFVLSMVLLVISGNLVVLFLGWELIGLTSFLLINFWSTRVGTLKAAFKAYTFNKVSDLSLFFAIVLVYYSFNEITFSKLSYLFFLYNDYTLSAIVEIRTVELISFFFLLAAFIKSAQAGFHIWLPDSMEAPVPASALIHSATLVSAGIFLGLRLQPLLELSVYFHTVVPLLASFTAFIGGFGAFFQTDLKRVLAYSTISHCGFLFFLTCFNCVEYTLIYLYVHGFFKASSFLCVGNIIRFSKNYQDVRRMGAYWNFLPFELYMLAFCLLNLSGLPLFFGFLIKHFLFLSLDFMYFNVISFAFIFLAAFSGIFYSFKVFFYVFFDSKKARFSTYYHYVTGLTRSKMYSNTTLGGTFAIFFLVSGAVIFSFLLFMWLFALRVNILTEVSFYIGKTGAFAAFNTDLGLLFNFKFLNTVICVFFFFISFFRWTRSFVFSFELLYFYISFLFLLLS